jgi:hypothetical protein
MTILIDPTIITAVLLEDGWHQVAPQSFVIDYIQFNVQGGSFHKGAAWTEGQGASSGAQTFAPMASILALRYSTST